MIEIVGSEEGGGIVGANSCSPDDWHTARANGHSPLHPLRRSMQAQSISSFAAGFKSIVTKRINILRQTPRLPVWQRNYYEHVIMTDKALDTIREYIICNPMNWETDRNNPRNF